MLEQVVAQTPSAVAVLLGPDHEFRYFNEAFLRLVPAGRVEAGRTVADALPEAVEAALPLLDRAFRGETVVLDTLQIPFTGPESFRGHRYYRGLYSPLLEGGRPIGVLITATDITDDVRRRQDLEAELARERDLARQLQESEARFRALFSAIDEGYCLCEMVLDPDGRPMDYRFLEANPQFEAMTGLIGAVGRTALEMVPDLEPRWVETYARVALGGDPVRFQQGSEAMGRSFDVFATPVEPRGRFALVFNDITQRELAERLRGEAEAAERRSRVQAEVLNAIHRELGTIEPTEGQARRLAELLVEGVGDVALVELPAPDGAVSASAGRAVGVSTPDAVWWATAPIDVGEPQLGSVAIGVAAGAPGMPAPEAEEFVRRVAESVGTLVARLRAGQREHQIAIRLQEALLPPGVGGAEGVTLAARYEAGSAMLEVGGDFYDTFTFADGHLGVAVGDVVGHGLEAAASMGRLRTALTALAAHAGGPGELLSHLDAYASGYDAVPFATACCAALDPQTGELRHASAGHPPILMVPTDGAPTWLQDGRSAALHGDPQSDRPEGSLTLRPGSLLILYSDGLVERRGESLSEGLARLGAAAARVRDKPVEAICDHLLAELGRSQSRDDDVAVLCLRLNARS